MELLKVLSSRSGHRRPIIRLLSDHSLVILRIPGGSLRERAQFPLGERLNREVRHRVRRHLGDPSGPVGRNRVEFEAKAA
jgi:hypothetical protein